MSDTRRTPAADVLGQVDAFHPENPQDQDNHEPQDQGPLDERRRLLHELFHLDASPPPRRPMIGCALLPSASSAAAPEPRPQTKDQRRQMMRRATESTASLSDASQPEAMDAAATPMSPQAAPTPQDKVNDPFLYFSSDKRRMEHLLGKELPSMSAEEPTRRKKRISFELDPSYALVTRFPELLLNDMDQEEAKEGEENES